MKKGVILIFLFVVFLLSTLSIKYVSPQVGNVAIFQSVDENNNPGPQVSIRHALVCVYNEGANINTGDINTCIIPSDITWDESKNQYSFTLNNKVYFVNLNEINRTKSVISARESEQCINPCVGQSEEDCGVTTPTGVCEPVYNGGGCVPRKFVSCNLKPGVCYVAIGSSGSQTGGSQPVQGSNQIGFEVPPKECELDNVDIETGYCTNNEVRDYDCPSPAVNLASDDYKWKVNCRNYLQNDLMDRRWLGQYYYSASGGDWKDFSNLNAIEDWWACGDLERDKALGKWTRTAEGFIQKSSGCTGDMIKEDDSSNEFPLNFEVNGDPNGCMYLKESISGKFLMNGYWSRNPGGNSGYWEQDIMSKIDKTATLVANDPFYIGVKWNRYAKIIFFRGLITPTNQNPKDRAVVFEYTQRNDAPCVYLRWEGYSKD